MEQQQENKSPLKNPYVYSSLLIFIVLIYVGYIMYSRRESSREFERVQTEKSTEQRREEDRKAIEQLGGSELAIQSLYVMPATIHRGEKAQLCYNVSNAKAVSLDPPEGTVWPSHSRCLDLSPKKTTTYKLTITGAAGQTVDQSVELKVR
ncbi:MAG: hypothetical protein M3N22_08295 [Acidobacteriota bacterium]|nr:hypothetical protein [Acidobacteriota bacterium]